MEFQYICSGIDGMESCCWTGTVRFLSQTAPYEIEVNARGSYFHIVFGKHKYGNYICIPNWGIGTELSAFTDQFWNLGRIRQIYPGLSDVDAVSIVKALAEASKKIKG